MLDGPILSTFEIVFIMVCAATVIIALILARMVRPITFYGSSTDNEKQARTAAAVGIAWCWPSEMHKYIDGGLRTRMKDSFILALVAIQRVLGDRTSDYPLVVLCIIANSVSALLVFAIASAYWSISVGLLVWGLLVTCLWSYYLALFGTHIPLAQMFFLASVYAIQQAQAGMTTAGLGWYVVSGIATGLMLFSSASSRKYVPLVLGAFVYSQRMALWNSEIAASSNPALSSGVHLTVLWVMVALVIGALAIGLSYKRIIAAMYFEHAPGWLSRFMTARQSVALQQHLDVAKPLAGLVIKTCLGVACYLGVSLALVRTEFFYLSHLAVFLGAGTVVLLLNYPDPIKNLWAYYKHSQGWKRNRFSLYRRFFESIGKPIKEDMRGAGFLWIARYFLRVAPVHASLYAACIVLLVGILALHGRVDEIWEAGAIVALSLSPALWGELTHCAQMGRSYYPSLIGSLTLVAYIAFKLDRLLPPAGRIVLWAMAAGLVMTSAIWTVRMFRGDVWPARMAPAWLAQTLKELGVKEFYTYDTPYNDALVDALPPAVREQYTIHFIDSLRDAKEGYVVVPATSAKAFHMEGQQWAIVHGDFDLDPELTRLIESKEIARYAVASFKTFGTSRIWVHESEVMSYRDLILGEISNHDRWRGMAWLLDAGKLYAERARNLPAEIQGFKPGHALVSDDAL